MKFLRRTRHVASIVTLLVIVGSLFALDMKLHRLQPQLVADQQKRQMAKQQAQAAERQNQPSSSSSPAVLPPTDTDEERRADRKKQIAIDSEMAYWTRILAGTGIASVIITGLILAFQTIYTRKAANAAYTNATTAMLAERAYLTMLHRRPGLSFDSLDVQPHDNGPTYRGFSIEIILKNVGHTPATTIQQLVCGFVTNQPLPVVPPYDSQWLTSLSVPLRSDSNYRSRKQMSWPVTDVERAQGVASQWRIYVIGYTDYADIFGKTHRAGFAREYDPQIDRDRPPAHLQLTTDAERKAARRSNLRWVKQLGYNYDWEIDENGNKKN